VYGKSSSIQVIFLCGHTNVNDIVEVRSSEELFSLTGAGTGSVLLAGCMLRSTPESKEDSRSVVQVTALLAGRVVEDSGLVLPNETVSEGTD
jgi:hypothetical protein